MSADCIFCKIARKEIPSHSVFEDERCLVFHDINPVAPIHLVVIPKAHVSALNDYDSAEDAGWMLVAAKEAAKKLGFAEEGYRVVFNVNRAAGQEVFHVHAHILAGRNLGWPPG